MGTRQTTTNDDDGQNGGGGGGGGHFPVIGGGGADRDGDGQKEGEDEGEEKKRLIQKPLPERVCELFLMQDFNGGPEAAAAADSRPFFRSAFMRERLPQMLFSNGANGLDGNGAGGSVVRNIPIKVLSGGGDGKKPQREEPAANLNSSNGRMAGSVLDMDRTADEFFSSASTPPDRFSLMSSPELRRHFASLFWTPQQARRIAEREEGQQQRQQPQFGTNRQGEDSSGRLDRGLGGGSSVTVYSIPISSHLADSREEIVGTGQKREAGRSEQKQPQAMGGGPYSAIPFRRRAGMNSALSTPSLFGNEGNMGGNSPMTEKPPPPAPPSSVHHHSATTNPRANALPNNNNKPTSFPANHHHPHQNGPTQFNQPQSQLPLRRTQTAFTLPQQELPRRDSEPSILLAEDAQRRLMAASSMEWAHQSLGPKLQQYSADSSSTSTTMSDDSGSVISTSTSDSTSSATATPIEMTANARSKSPSLLSLRQSLLRLRPSRRNNGNAPAISAPSSLLPACVRSRQSSGSDQGEEENEEDEQAAQNDLNRELREQRMGARNGSTNGSNPALTASSLRLTEFVPKPERRRGGAEKSPDAVEEAIRSLEQFDPSEFVQRQYGVGDRNRRPSVPPSSQSRTPPSAVPRGVFLAKAESVPIRQPHQSTTNSSSLLASSLPFDRRSSLTFYSPISSSSSPSSSSEGRPSPSSMPPHLLHHPFPPPSFQQLPRRPSNATISSGSATPTQQIGGGGGQPIEGGGPSSAFGHSLDFDSNRTPRANSPTENGFGTNGGGGGMPEMDRLINRLKGHQRRRGVTFNDQPTQHFYSPFDGPPPDYSESGSDGKEEMENGSVADSEDGELMRNAAALEAEAQLRKRFLCSQLTDCAKVIEINAMKMGQFVATGSGLGGWRQPHILRHNLGAIRDTIYTVEFALDELVESLCRVSLDPRDPRRAHLQQLAQPVQTSLAMLRKLRASLDSTGWSLSALGRPREQQFASSGHDALDQLVAILPQLPKDCLKLVQWIYSLSIWPDPRSCRPAAAFLPASASSSFRPTLHPAPPPPAPLPPQNHQNGFGIQPRPPSPTSSLQNYYSSGEEEQLQREKTNAEAKGGNGPEVMDGGESTSSTTSSVQTLLESEMVNGGAGKGGERQQQPPVKEADVGLVLEEDDLASVISDGHWPDHASLHSPPGPASLHRRVNAELSRSLSPDQRDLFRLYEPQVDGHITAMCSLIEEFFSLVESNKEPKLSFQKIQMIYIEGHSLCGIIRVLSRDDSISQHRPLSAFLHHECAKLDSLLNECLAAAKVAKTKAQNWSRAQTVPAVQTMCQAVVAVSECANQLRGFWGSCA